MSHDLSLLKQCVDDIIEYAEETKGEPRDEFIDGKLLAYNEVLSVIKSNFFVFGHEELGLDFDIDEFFLGKPAKALSA